MSDELDGWFGDYAVRLRNVSATGALVQCDEDIPAGARALLRFFRGGSELELLAEFTGGALTFLEDMELLLAREANALGNREQNVYGDQTLTAASSRVSSAFVSWTLGANGWSSHASLVAEQPANGFTVYATEPEDEVALLRSTYENGDEEARQLTRTFAELSIRKSER